MSTPEEKLEALAEDIWQAEAMAAAGNKLMKNVLLPRVMSQLLDIAALDLIKVENDPEYIISMAAWHTPTSIVLMDTTQQREVCAVCLAGAVMAKTLGVPKTKWVTPFDFSRNDTQLQALNFMRENNFETAWVVLGQGDMTNRKRMKLDALISNKPIPKYKDDPKWFRAALTRVSEELKQVGL